MAGSPRRDGTFPPSPSRSGREPQAAVFSHQNISIIHPRHELPPRHPTTRAFSHRPSRTSPLYRPQPSFLGSVCSLVIDIRAHNGFVNEEIGHSACDGAFPSCDLPHLTSARWPRRTLCASCCLDPLRPAASPDQFVLSISSILPPAIVPPLTLPFLLQFSAAQARAFSTTRPAGE